METGRKWIGRKGILHTRRLFCLFAWMALGCAWLCGCAATQEDVQNPGQLETGVISSGTEVTLPSGKTELASSEAQETAVSGMNEEDASLAGKTPDTVEESVDFPAEEDIPDHMEIPMSKDQLRPNTPLGQQMYKRAGYQPLCWNTKEDGSGENIPFGSRADGEAGTILYVKWVPETPKEAFVWEEREDGAYITGFVDEPERTGSQEQKELQGLKQPEILLVIPDELGGLPVRGIAAGAFDHSAFDCAVLPPSMRKVEAGAFSDSALSEIWLYDSLTEISDACFEGCENLKTLHIGADTKPRYETSYFGAFADKMDWLRANKDKKKLILAGGSATRFAYNSLWLIQELPDYVPVNMGVYAYANMLPQYRLIELFSGEGDVLVSAPEFDTTETQFCPSDALDYLFFAMAEADYGNVALLDLRQFTQVFDSFGTYLMLRADLPELSYEDSPKHFDDDGNEIPYDTYNPYGDYTLSRPGALEDKMLMYFRADYRVEAFPEELVESLNRVYRELEEKGVRVFFAYAPRNWSSLTEGSTKEARQALAAYLEEKLAVPVLFDMEESLYPGTLFYLIDSHLCDEGARLYTQMMAQALKKILEPVS